MLPSALRAARYTTRFGEQTAWTYFLARSTPSHGVHPRQHVSFNRDYLDLTLPTNDGDADIEIVTPQEKIYGGRSNLQILNLHLAHEPRQDGVAEDHLALRRSDRQSETGLERHERRAGSPGLRITGHGIPRQPLTMPSHESTEQLRQAMKIEDEADLKESGHDFLNLFLETISRQADGNHGIVVGPHRSIMIRHRVIPAFGTGEGSNPPPAEHPIGHERLRRSLSMLVARNSRV